MNSTWIALAQGYEGVIGFAIFFLAPGFLLASAVNFNAFRVRSRAEKLLWSISLSLPLTIQICVMGGRLFSPRVVLAVLICLSVAALALLLMRSKGIGPIRKSSRSTYAVILLASLLGLYLVFAVTDIQIGRHLYVSTVLYDWSVRVPMVDSAMRSGVPPVNGLSALDGHPASLHYFYFWYVLCADLARLTHIPARASLAASTAWAAWALLSAFFLCLRYLLGVRRDLRLLCGLSFAVLGIIGLDLLPTLALLMSRGFHPYLEIEWWHQDRTPSLLGTAMNSPHHLVALACLLTGFLILVMTLSEQSSEKMTPPYAARLIFASLIAGLCFSSAAGSSILATVVVTIACLVWALDLIRQQQFRTLIALGGSCISALLLSSSFLRELQTKTGAVAQSFLSIRWRNYDFVRFYQVKYHLLGHSSMVNEAMTQGGILAIHLSDLGFFAFVLLYQIRRDRKRKLQPSERAAWALLIGTSISYLFLSSASIASPNDLGFDAGLLLRLLLQLWAVVWIYQLWTDWREGRFRPQSSSCRRFGFVLAAALIVIGWGGQILQMVWERTYFPLVGSQTVHKQLDVLTTDHLSDRLYNVRQAYRDFDQIRDAPAGSTSIQYNPISPMQPALTFYSTHQIAAFDPGCGTGYGGDYAACLVVMPRLLALYGNTQAGIDRARAGNVRQDGAASAVATTEDANAMCRDLHLAALVAESLDSVWSKPNSWVWTMKPVVANDTVRVFRCPAS